MRARQQAICEAERRFPVRIKVAVPPEGFGSRLDQIFVWLDANCGADGWTSAPSSTRGVVNDALAIYFADVTIANAFVARWCTSQKVEIVDGGIGSGMTNRHHEWERACTKRPDGFRNGRGFRESALS